MRKAVQAAIDVDGIVRSIYRGGRTRAWGILSPADHDFYDASIERAYGFDPKRANALLDEAGWIARDGQRFRTKDGARLPVEVMQAQVTLRDQRDLLIQAAPAQGRQNAGIDLVPILAGSGTYTDRQNSGRYGAISNSTAEQEDGLTLYFRDLPRQSGGSID